IAISLFSGSAYADGIDCTKAADAVDKIVCASDELKAQDKTMAELYALAKVNMFGQGPSGEIGEQRTWLSERKDCTGKSDADTEHCLVEVYKDRNTELAFAIMPVAPEKAFQVLNDQKSKTVPVFEAMSLFASEPDGSDWSNSNLETKRKAILDLTTPIFQTLQKGDADDSNTYGKVVKDLLEDAGLKAPEDILKSSKSFGGFLRAATLGIDNTKLPCGYVTTHPGLLAATESYFGSAMENQVINSDCVAVAPPTPQFTTLIKQINDGWPQCDGSIKFAYYRSFGVAVDEALAPSEQLINEFAPAKANHKSEKAPALDGVSKTVIQSSTRELAAYYVKYLKVAPDKAATYATAKIAGVLKTGQQCDE
ncbi:MAG TPA: hypothetical protein VII21_05015, partial [Aestuariivirga sp.]